MKISILALRQLIQEALEGREQFQVRKPGWVEETLPGALQALCRRLRVRSLPTDVALFTIGGNLHAIDRVDQPALRWNGRTWMKLEDWAIDLATRESIMDEVMGQNDKGVGL